MKKIVVLILLIWVSNLWAGACKIDSVRVADIPVERLKGEFVIPWDLLSKGKLMIEGEASGNVEKVEVTVDGGKNWESVNGTELWDYEFTPSLEKKFKLGVRACCSGKCYLYRRKFYNLIVSSKTSRDIIENKFLTISIAYETKNLGKILPLFSKWIRSPLYSNYRDLEVQIRNDFQWGEAIQYKFFIDQILKNENIYMVRTHWFLTYLGLLEPKEGDTEFHFDASQNWKIVDIRGDKPFGIIEEPKPDLYIAEDEVTGIITYNYYDNDILIVVVHNDGIIAARKVLLKVKCGNNYTPYKISTKLIKVVPIKGVKVVNVILPKISWEGTNVRCTIWVDPYNRISELNEDNNVVEKVFEIM